MKKLLLSIALFASGVANAALYTADYGAALPGYFPNDDAQYQIVPPADLLSGTPYNRVFVSNNGWINLLGVVPFSSIRATSSDLFSANDPLHLAGVFYKQDGDRLVFTWSNMGYFWSNYSNRETFQIVFDMSAHEVGIFYGDTGLMTTPYAGVNTNDVSNQTTRPNLDTRYFNFLTASEIGGFSDSTVAEVPEPGTLALVALGVVGLAAFRRKRA